LADQPEERGDVSVYDMIGAIGKIMNRRKWNKPRDTKIEREEIPIEERMNDIMKQVKQTKVGVEIEELLEYPSRQYIVASFIAILELMKSNAVICSQKAHFQSIRIYSVEG